MAEMATIDVSSFTLSSPKSIWPIQDGLYCNVQAQNPKRSFRSKPASPSTHQTSDQGNVDQRQDQGDHLVAAGGQGIGNRVGRLLNKFDQQHEETDGET